MRFTLAALALLSAVSAALVARQEIPGPPCVRNCLEAAMYNSGNCSPLDPACYCQQESTMAGVDGCLKDQCAERYEEARASTLAVCAQVIADDSTYTGVRNSGGPLTSTLTSTTVAATTTATLISATTIDAVSSSLASVSSEVAASASSNVESVSSSAASVQDSLAASASSVAASASSAAEAGRSSVASQASSIASSASAAVTSALASATSSGAASHLTVGSGGILAGLLAMIVAL